MHHLFKSIVDKYFSNCSAVLSFRVSCVPYSFMYSDFNDTYNRPHTKLTISFSLAYTSTDDLFGSTELWVKSRFPRTVLRQRKTRQTKIKRSCSTTLWDLQHVWRRPVAAIVCCAATIQLRRGRIWLGRHWSLSESLLLQLLHRSTNPAMKDPGHHLNRLTGDMTDADQNNFA